MMWRHDLDLISTVKVDDGGGGYTEEDAYRPVLANKKSVRQSEFYQAHAEGLKPELVMEVHYSEYNDEQKLRFPSGEGGKRYKILRTFSKNEEKLELICERDRGV